MIERRLHRQLEEVARRIRRVRLWGSLATVWLLAAVLGGTILWADLPVRHGVPLVALSAAGVAAVCGWYALRSVRDYRSVARRIEARHPELNACLLAAVEQTPELPGGRFGFLQDRVIGTALEHAYRHPWRRAVPGWQLLGLQLGSYASLLLLAGVLLSLLLYTRSSTRLAAAGGRDSVLYSSGSFDVEVQPGNAEVERGTSLLVLARFRGRLPAETALVYRMGEQTVELPMSKSLDDPVFGGRIPDIRQELDYEVQFADQRSESFHVTVFDYPQLQRADVQLDYPGYTGLEPRLIQDVRQVSAVQGTQLTLLCYLNKAVAEARLAGAEGATIPLVADDPAAAGDPAEPLLYKATLELQTTQRLRLELTDEQGRKNQDPPEFVFHALPNKPADLRIVQPARDVQVSPLEELQLQASIWDDFGLARYGLSYAIAGGVNEETVLGQDIRGNERVEAASLIAFESLEAEPDQLLSYYFWAEDVGPDGNVRRTFSDMYFAEVRHFEEIFRQGQQPPGGAGQQQSPESPGGGQGQNANQAEELGDIQKEIINATWKLIRRETAATPSNSYAEDAALVRDSQAAALEMLEELAANIQDAESLGHVEAVREQMQGALSHLSEASQNNEVAPLQPALAAEQAAYQSLLKLRAREFEVVRANAQQQRSRSQSSRGSSSRAQRQLQELELSNTENRYETERSAQNTEQSTAEREVRQVLNRLRELARRQNDLNERLKELQSALEEAQDEQQREELRRQLQRLQDEQQQILRDMDELNSRMNQPENREQMADSRQQLQQSRENVRQASEALEQGMVPQAIASGTRAERELNELREEFRRQASGQFDEQMREMREEAQQLDQRQQDLSQRLGQLDDASPRSGSLRDAGERENIQQQFQEQQQNLKDLLDRMRETVEAAEATEPLLAEQLYDTVRDAQHQNVERALESARRSLERGLLDDSRNEERVAQGGISRLREGVERAAESVLGDETEALRRAQQELERLSHQLDEEIARAQGRSDTPADREGQDAADLDRGGQRPDGQPQQEGQQQPGQQQPGQQQPGQQQEGQREQQDGQQGRQGQRQQGEQQEGQGQSGQPGEQQPGEQQPGQSPDAQQGRQPGSGARRLTDGDPEQQRDAQPGSGQRGADRPPGERDGQQPGSPSLEGGQRSDDRLGGMGVFLNDGNRTFAPLAGEDYLDWSDRLRDVEEMIDDPELRAEAARIRDRARGFRTDLKRHSRPPNWDLVLDQVARPLVELRDRIAEELLRRASRDALVPIDRDPVPPKYADQVRLYYERLGRGK